MRSCYLVLYDIADSRRSARVASLLLNHGVRIQRSVFEIRLERGKLPELQKRLTALINRQEDGIKIFPVCQKCRVKADGSGNNGHLQNERQWFIL